MTRHHVSPSQLEAWGDPDAEAAGGDRGGCEAKWWYSRNRPRRHTEATRFGEDMHLALELWLRDGAPPNPRTPVGRAALELLPLLPMPGQAVVELAVDVELEGVLWKPRIDWHIPPSTDVLFFGDHKSTRDLVWRKPPEVLREDPQFVGYARALLVHYPWVRTFAGRWGYSRRPTKTSPPKAEPTDVVMGVDEMLARFDRIHHRRVLPLLARAHLPREHHRRNLGHCEAYGGCHYRAECLVGISPVDITTELLHKAYTRGADPWATSRESINVDPNLAAHLQQNAGGAPAQPFTMPTMPGMPAPAQPAAPAPSIPQWTPPVAPAAPPAVDLSGLPDDVVRYCQSEIAKGVDVAPMVAAYRAQVAAAAAGQQPSAPHTPASTAPTSTTTAAPATRGRGRPAKSSGVKLLEACASGGLSIESAEAYLGLLAELEAQK